MDEIVIRHGEARYVVREVAIAHAIVGEKISLSALALLPGRALRRRAARSSSRGTLERIDAKASATVAGVPAEAHALVTPFAPQKAPVARGAAPVPLDLARFDASLPHTALSASLKAAPTAGGAFAGTLSATNAAAGPIDAGRLPVARLETRFLTDFASARLSQARAALHGGGTVSRRSGAAARLGQRPSGRFCRRSARPPHQPAPDRAHRPAGGALEGERHWARGSLTQEGIGLTAEILRIGELLEVRELRALAEGGEVSGTGKIRLDAAMSFDARVTVERFDPAAIGDYPAGSLSGRRWPRPPAQPRQIDLEVEPARQHAATSTPSAAQGTARITGERVTQADADCASVPIA